MTHDGLDMHSVLPCVKSKFIQPITESHTLDCHDKLIQAMATCHSLTQIDGELTGDPLDLSMFQFTKWVGWTIFRCFIENCMTYFLEN